MVYVSLVVFFFAGWILPYAPGRISSEPGISAFPGGLYAFAGQPRFKIFIDPRNIKLTGPPRGWRSAAPYVQYEVRAVYVRGTCGARYQKEGFVRGLTAFVVWSPKLRAESRTVSRTSTEFGSV